MNNIAIILDNIIIKTRCIMYMYSNEFELKTMVVKINTKSIYRLNQIIVFLTIHFIKVDIKSFYNLNI